MRNGEIRGKIRGRIEKRDERIRKRKEKEGEDKKGLVREEDKKIKCVRREE